MSVYEKLKGLNIELPVTKTRSRRSCHLHALAAWCFCPATSPRRTEPWEGQLGANLTVEQGKEAARGVAIDLIGTLNAAVGDLNLIRRIVKMQVLVNSTPAFTDQHLVANGASELLVDVFGECGAHARAAFGVAQVPFGSCVEIDLIAEVDEK